MSNVKETKGFVVHESTPPWIYPNTEKLKEKGTLPLWFEVCEMIWFTIKDISYFGWICLDWTKLVCTVWTLVLSGSTFKSRLCPSLSLFNAVFLSKHCAKKSGNGIYVLPSTLCSVQWTAAIALAREQDLKRGFSILEKGKVASCYSHWYTLPLSLWSEHFAVMAKISLKLWKWINQWL